MLVLPPLIWGWLTYRVMAFDALAEHASKDERREVLRRHQVTLLGMGVLTGYLGLLPVLCGPRCRVCLQRLMVPLAVGHLTYTLVLRFHRLVFTHLNNAGAGAIVYHQFCGGRRRILGVPGQVQPPPSPP